MSRKDVDKLRAAIDAVDQKLLKQFNQRAKLVSRLGKIKKGMGLKLYDGSREKAILDRLRQSNRGPLSEEAIVRLFERLIDESRHLERIEAYDDKDD